MTTIDPDLTLGHRALERHLRARGAYDLADVARQVADERESGGKYRARSMAEWLCVRDIGEWRRVT